ncbi:MAG: PEP/pyruvate-binding domain-containing protein [Desulfovibrionaceae bacterium]
MFLAQLFKHWTYQVFAPGALLRNRYNAFKELLRQDDEALSLIADLEDICHGREHADFSRVHWLFEQLSASVKTMVDNLMEMSPTRYLSLPDYLRKIDFYVRLALDEPPPDMSGPYVIPLAEAARREQSAGGKAANLARAAAATGAGVPEGFVVTAQAFHYLLEHNGLREAVDEALRQAVASRPEQISRACRSIQEMVRQADIPLEAAEPLQQWAEGAAARSATGLLAVRSSAVSEDGRASFAGLYDSQLHVAPEDVSRAYLEVLAGKYGERAVTYRILHGLTDRQTGMAALVLPMIDARCAGVAYSLDAVQVAGQAREAVSIYATKGLGVSLVEGGGAPQVSHLSRDATPRVLERILESPTVLLEDEACREIARLAMSLENLFGGPQDVEWAMDRSGRLTVLQSRPLHVEDSPAEPDPPGVDAPVLMDDLDRAAGGSCCGRIHRLASLDELDQVPDGAVILAESLHPALTSVVRRAAGVVSASGSRATHFASVAREMGAPVLVGGPRVLEELAEGSQVSLDADAGRIYAGRVESLARPSRPRAPGPLDKRCATAMPLISRLNLTHPDAAEFRPEGVKSMHDVVRFSHEKAVSEMFSLVGKSGRGLAKSKRLKSRLPLIMYVLDLGGGLFPEAAEAEAVTPEDVASTPMWAVWWGLSTTQAQWNEDMPHLDWEEFDRISGGLFKLDSRLLASYAVLSADYVHLMIRFGYHFSVLDSVCGPEAKNNYASFRFKGGGAGFEQRLLRLDFMEAVLGHYGFATSRKGDMLDARISRLDEAGLQRRLAHLGRLLARTRLLDMSMTSSQQAEELAREFISSAEAGPGEEAEHDPW